MVNTEYENRIDNLTLPELYKIYQGLDSVKDKEIRKKIISKINTFTDESLNDIPDYSNLSKEEIVEERYKAVLNNYHLRLYLINDAIKNAESDSKEPEKVNDTLEISYMANKVTKMENVGETKKVYSEKAINVATFLGGPLATGIMMSENFKVMELFETARKALFVGIISMFAMISLLFLLPSPIVDKIPQQFIPLIYTGIAWFLFKRYQKEKIEELLKEKAQKHSGWRIFGIGIGSMAVFIIVFLPFALLTPAYEGEVLKFNKTGDEIYYDESISKNDIKEIGRALTTLQFFNPEYSVAIQVRDDGTNTYRVIFPVDKSFWLDEQLIYEMGNLSHVFKEFVPEKEFKISLLSESIAGEERKDL